MATPQKKCYPKKLIKKKLATPKKIKKMATPKMLAYFIARGFIIAFWANGVLYCVRVY